MTEFIGNGLLFVAIVGGIAYGVFIAWRRGKFTRIGFAPKVPTTPPPENKP